LLLSLLSACNRPAQEPPPDNLATFVSATLTAQPSLTARLPTPLPTWTLPAPFTTETATPEPSETPEPTIATTPTGTPLPLEPDDPRLGLNLSSPDFSDDFSDFPGAWFQFEDEDAIIRWEDGRLRATDNKADGFIWWSTSARLVEDVYAEVSVEMDQCAGRDAYGVAVRVGGDNFDRGYTLEVSCEGQYRVRRFISEAAPAVLLDWTPAGAIVTGSGAVNRIGILCVGEAMHFVANGEVLNSQAVTDGEYSSGFVGLFASAAQTPGLTVYFDNLALWYP
jgi:hypothetical protein